MEYHKAYELYIDFIKSYVNEIFIDGTRNNIISYYNTRSAQESLFLYKKVFEYNIII